MSKIVSLNEAIAMIPDGANVCVGGFVGCMHPEALTKGIEEHFLNNGKPKNLTLIYPAGQGDGGERGLNHFGHEGLLRRVIGGHWALAPKLQKLALDNKIEAYNFPQGVLAHMMRDVAAGRPGTLTHVGLHTFVDPELEGGRLNSKTTENLVHRMKIKEKDYLFFDAQPIDIALVRATYADPNGNATFERECVQLEMVAMCQAAKNSGGKVILQVEQVVERGSLDTRLVRIPGIYVDAIVVAPHEEHMQTFATRYNPSYSGEVRTHTPEQAPMPLDARKIIARRCAMELTENSVVNLGIGIPESVATVAAEEGIGGFTLTVESGAVGGIPASGQDFGASFNPDCILDQPTQFDFYDGGGLDIAFLGLAQADQYGNVNVSKFGPKIAGCGGFIDITQNAKRLVYCGTFTANGLKVAVEDGKLIIRNEGKIKKLISDVEQITFSGKYACEKGQQVLYVTERAVFELTCDGMRLIEIAPGVDLQKDVLDQMEFVPQLAENIALMSPKIFEPQKMNLGQ